MGAYTHLNLSDVDDAAVGFGLSPNLEARFSRKPLGSSALGVSREVLAPGFRVPFGHTHRDQEEVYVVVSGSGRMKIGDDIVDLAQGDLVRVSPGVWRCTEAGDEGLEVLAVGAPITEENDAEIEQGWWAEDGPSGS